MRLFAAVLPPAGAVAELGAAVDGLRALPGSDGLRWTGREGWHFTLAFLGEVDERLLPELTARLARAARRAGVRMAEHRRYQAHLTIARGRTEEVSLTPFVSGLSGFEGASWPVSRFALVRSDPPEPGAAGARPRYETVAEWHLGAEETEGPG
ncbi:2'-5' RNA ligase family protein [Streptomyces sp. NPDC014894]|uniref:2'-5' RNA ligase family protein n=1 Tax=Streptomyces sp. NPDC014894 TaxID=3364931 RepID=UPI0036FCF425